MRRKCVPVVITKDGQRLQFRTLRDAALHIGASRNTVSCALHNGRTVHGWLVAKASGTTPQYTEAQRHAFRPPTQEPPPQYNELFTRKPFGATGMWRRYGET